MVDGAGMLTDDDDTDEAEEDTFNIGDLVNSMKQIGFIPIDQVVVKKLSCDPTKYIVIEGNRRISAAKYLKSLDLPTEPEKAKAQKAARDTLESIDVLLLVTDGLSDEVIHDQIGVVLGLRHFGSVLGWGTLAKAVNIYSEYKLISPAQDDFVLDNARLGQLVARLSQSRANLTNALKTYVVYLQLQEAYPTSPPRPVDYSLLQACVVNRKLQAAEFIGQNQSTYKLNQESLERLHQVCEFGNRAELRDEQKILKIPRPWPS